MTKVFNKKKLQSRRRILRHNLSKAEAVLWTYIKNKQILGQRFLRQFSIESYIVDFFCPKLHLAIEVDGISHTYISDIKKDIKRQKKIESYGVSFLRFTNEEILGDLNEVLEEVKSKIISIMNPPSPL
jgi:very-short-patch-repair endonuclease